MALVLNGDGNITGLVAGGLPDGSVTADDIASTLDLSGKTVTLPAGTGGKVLQVATWQTIIGSNFSTSSNSFVDPGFASLDITPVASNSKILVTYSGLIAHINYNNGNHGVAYKIYRSVDSGSYAETVSAAIQAGAYDSNSSGWSDMMADIRVLDTPTYSLGSTLHYKVYYRKSSSSTNAAYFTHLGGLATNTNNPQFLGIAMEIAA